MATARSAKRPFKPTNSVTNMPTMTMRRMLADWDDVRFFLAVVRSGSFTKAGRMLNANQSTVSRRIEGMEDRLGCQLFDRHAKGIQLTPAGADVLAQAERIDAAVIELERRLDGRDLDLHGLVRVSGTENLVAFWLVSRLWELQTAHPQIELEIVAEDAVVDLARREADVAIRLVRPDEPSLNAERVGVLRFGLFCSESYLKDRTEPKSMEDLAGHRVIDFASNHASRVMADWNEFVAAYQTVTFRTNSSCAYLSAVRAGLGIGLFPLYMRHVAPELVELPVPIDFTRDIWLVTHKETAGSAKIRLVSNCLRGLFEKDRAAWFS